MAKKSLLFLLVLIISAVVGSFTGEFLQSVLPEGGAFYNLFGVEEKVGISPTKLNLIIVEFTFGCMFKLNLMSVLFMIVAGYVFKVVTSKPKVHSSGEVTSESVQNSDEKRNNTEK